jgi:hypothetical protein
MLNNISDCIGFNPHNRMQAFNGNVNAYIITSVAASLLTYMYWPTMPSYRPLMTVATFSSLFGMAAGISPSKNSDDYSLYLNGKDSDQKRNIAVIFLVGTVASGALLGFNGLSTYFIQSNFTVHATQFLLITGISFAAGNQTTRFLSVYCGSV